MPRGFWIRRFCLAPRAHSNLDELALHIKGCSNLENAKRLHESAHGNGRFLENLVVEMYARCGSLVDAFWTFESILDKNVYSWTIMITAFAQNGHPLEALRVFRRMDLEGIKPNKVTFISVVTACSHACDLETGCQVHSRTTALGLDRHSVLGTALLAMYCNTGCLEIAWELFRGLGTARTVASWSVMITAYAHEGHLLQCIDLYREMDLEPNEVTYMALLGVCSTNQEGCIGFGRDVHGDVAQTKYYDHHLVRNSLVNMYAKCGYLNEAREVFDLSCEGRTVVTWNTMIAAYGQMGYTRECFQLFREMLLHGFKADRVTYLSLLEACHQDVVEGRRLHEMIQMGDIVLDVVLSNSLLTMYAKNGCFQDAKILFDGMKARSLISWNTLISVAGRKGHFREALELFWRVELEGVKANWVTLLAVVEACGFAMDVSKCRAIQLRAKCFMEDSSFMDGGAKAILGNAVMHMYSKCKMVAASREIFESLQNLWSVASWNTMISAYAQGGESGEAVGLFRRMDLEGFAPDGRTYVSILEACSSGGAGLKAFALEVHRCVEANGYERDEMVSSALVSMYGRCGDHQKALRVVTNSDLGALDVVSWTTLITTCALNGRELESMNVLHEMQNHGIQPDEMVFAALISACARGGHLSDARACFLAMVGDNGIVPTEDHFSGVVNVLGRAGWLDEAESLIRLSPELSSSSMSWLTLLGACEVHAHIDKGINAAAHALERGDKSSLCYITLSNTWVE